MEQISEASANQESEGLQAKQLHSIEQDTTRTDTDIVIDSTEKQPKEDVTYDNTSFCDTIRHNDIKDNFSTTLTNETLNNQIIEDYLKQLIKSNAPITIANKGFGITTPYVAPKTLEEAKIIADRILKGI